MKCKIGDTNKMVTAVEWLQNQIKLTYDKEHRLPIAYILSLIKQAKEMEKQQILDAYWNGTVDIEKKDALIEAEDFYNKKYTN